MTGFEFLFHMTTEIETNNPSFFKLIKPLLVVIVVGIMKIKYIFTDQYVFPDSVFEQGFNHIPIQKHNIVIQAVVPFTNKFDDAKAFIVISKQ